MKTMKTSELTGVALDWAVAKALGEYKPVPIPNYSTDWAQGGPIIERELNNLFKWNKLNQEEPDMWCAVYHQRTPDCIIALQQDGPTPLIAAMRCYVASKLGDEVEIPEELL